MTITATTPPRVDERESAVRSYSRRWPVVFERAEGSNLHSVDGTRYLDFFAGAGALNYGHNDPALKQALIDYIERDGVTHALDMWTTARVEMLDALDEAILGPRNLDHKVVFPGPAGANSVEAALKLARKVTGRPWVACFAGAFHGMTLGALSVSGQPAVRASAGVALTHRTTLRYDDHRSNVSTIEDALTASPGGLDGTAAIIVETVQGEGGLDHARPEWLLGLAAVCRRNGILLVVDDVQMGCGRTGPFFSFEDAGIVPDIICLSKSISGYGMPMALTLVRPEFDIWKPAEHNGTFRGFSLAFVTGAKAIRTYWSDDELEVATRAKADQLERGLVAIVDSHPDGLVVPTGRGLARGLRTSGGATADRVSSAAFASGLLVETCGSHGEVVKLLPPLTTSSKDIDRALDILDASVSSALRTASDVTR